MLWMFRSGSEIRKIAFPVFVNCNHEGVFNPLTRDVVLIRSNHERGLSRMFDSILYTYLSLYEMLTIVVMWKMKSSSEDPLPIKEITKNSVRLNYIGWHLLNCRSTYCWMTPVSVNVSRVICERGAGSYWSAERRRKGKSQKGHEEAK